MVLPGTDKLSADVAAAAKANDPTGYLLAEHAWTRVILDALRDRVPSGVGSDEAEELRSFIDLHIRREEEAFFPALEPIVHQLGLGSTSEMYGEHDGIRIRLDELRDTIARQGNTAKALAALRRSLLVHFDNEEELLFHEAASRLTESTRREVIEGFQRL